MPSRIVTSRTLGSDSPVTRSPAPSPPVVPLTSHRAISGAPPPLTSIPALAFPRTVTSRSTGRLPTTITPAPSWRPAPSTTACSSRLCPDCGPSFSPSHAPGFSVPAVVKTIGFSAVPTARSSPAPPSPTTRAHSVPILTVTPGSIVSTGPAAPRTRTCPSRT